jgi:hypothetical protein
LVIRATAIPLNHGAIESVQDRWACLEGLQNSYAHNAAQLTRFCVLVFEVVWVCQRD